LKDRLTDGPETTEIRTKSDDYGTIGMAKIERNAPCPCGSGKKYKNCCEGSKIVKRSRKVNQFLTGLLFLVLLGAISVFYLQLDQESTTAAMLQEKKVPQKPGGNQLRRRSNMTDTRPAAAKTNRASQATAVPAEHPSTVDSSGTGLPNFPGTTPIPGLRKVELNELKPAVRENIERIAAEQQKKQSNTFPLEDQTKPQPAPAETPKKDSTR